MLKCARNSENKHARAPHYTGESQESRRVIQAPKKKTYCDPVCSLLHLVSSPEEGHDDIEEKSLLCL